MTARLTVATVVLASLAGGSPLAAQLTLGAGPALVDYWEREAGRTGSGFGIGAWAGYERGRIRAEIRGFAASLDVDRPSSPSFDVRQYDLRIAYHVIPHLDVEVGLGRRAISPALAAEEVGVVRVGIRSERRLSRSATVAARVALIPVAKFTSGGSRRFAAEAGFGAAIALGTRWGLMVHYDFQRIGREVQGLQFPIQMSVARVGVTWQR